MPPYSTPESHTWSYSRVRFKASHNSYERDEQPIVTQLKWTRARAYERACRGLELDLHQSGRNWAWSIDHLPPYSGSADRQLSEYLVLLRNFSKQYADHDVITVTLDLKEEASDMETFPWGLDSYVDRHLGADRLFTPAELQGVAPDLVSGAMSNGWPTLGQLCGKFILCLSGDEATKVRYVKGGGGRLCFADQRIDTPKSIPSMTSGSRVFFNFNFSVNVDWIPTIQHFSKQPGFVTRGYNINDAAMWRKAVRSKLNIIATDKVCNHDWALAGGTPFTRI